MCHSPGGEIRSSAGGVVQVGRGACSIRALGGDGRSTAGTGLLAAGAAGMRIMAWKPDTGVSAASLDRSGPESSGSPRP